MSEDVKKDYWRESQRSLVIMRITRVVTSIVFIVFLLFGGTKLYNNIVEQGGLKAIVTTLWYGEDDGTTKNK